VRFERGAKSLNGEGGSMTFARGQAIERMFDVQACQASGVFDAETFEHFGQSRATGNRRRTTISEKTHGLYAPFREAQEEMQAVAADWIDTFGDSIGLGQFACVSRV
jgi:hypothetical protein